MNAAKGHLANLVPNAVEDLKEVAFPDSRGLAIQRRGLCHRFPSRACIESQHDSIPFCRNRPGASCRVSSSRCSRRCRQSSVRSKRSPWGRMGTVGRISWYALTSLARTKLGNVPGR